MENKDWLYYKYSELSAEIRIQNNLKPTTKNRLDCTSFYSTGFDLRGIDFFANEKGMLFFNLSEPRDFVHSDSRRMAEKALTKTVKKDNYNYSSIYIDNPDQPNYGYGYPAKSKLLGKDKQKANPMYAFRDDLYLFIINEDYTEIECIIIPYKRNLSHQYFVKLWQGELDEQIEFFRMNSNVFYDYNGL